MSNILYFEGAGCAPRGEVENCRIRTAFHNADGKGIYLELIGNHIERRISDGQKYAADDCRMFVEFCFYLTGDNDDCNRSRIKITCKDINGDPIEYTKTTILNTVKSLGGQFEKIVVLPDLAGYRVHRDGGGYNFGDAFDFDPVLTVKRELIHSHYYNIERQEGKRYPNFSLWVDEDNPHTLHLLRHFNGYNKHWLIDTSVEDWRQTVRESTLGYYGC